MEIEITCNTPDAALFANVRKSSRMGYRWLKSSESHDGHAILVGGGPSLADNLHLIRRRAELGQKIFALNGAANFLHDHGITPDYQVLLDARPQNAKLVGPAKQYLIASQCHETVFEKIPQSLVTLWHPAMDGIEDNFPNYDDGYALVCGGTSVGISAMCLVYSMGYRKLHLFGYDSSHRANSGHAYKQPENLSDAPCTVTLNGQEFISTLTMTRQAERLPQVWNDLIDGGCTITMDGDGLARAVLDMGRAATQITEIDKYREVWSHPEYHHNSPGEREADHFVASVIPLPDDTVIDFGCGTGRGGQRIKQLTGCDVRLVDFVENSVDPDIALPFIRADLTKPMGLRADLGYCTDVMEHIPTGDVQTVIDNIMACVDGGYFRIAMFHDSWFGHTLHLSVFPIAWWREKFAAYNIIFEKEEMSPGPVAVFYVRHKSHKERN